ncbi:hypothetical protein ACFV2X_11460 [Streptomyces sp. NPDC059679]|uniref:hypothetical protein n=1 Tax=Streptomyces sp. NPDC059679 TaxID=3346903 RepID=UPI0036BC3BFC
MKFPVDDTTLSAWASLLNLTEEQTAATLEEIEQTLRVGYVHRPTEFRHLSFEKLTAEMDIDELALMFLVTGLRQAGHPEAADAVEIRGLVANLEAKRPSD